MPVSSALLLTNPGGHNTPSNQNFVRGDKATSSVKLRRKKEEGQTRKKNRHSGDFSFFANKKVEVQETVNNRSDFDYITFPNGVPMLHELRVGAGLQQPTSLDHLFIPSPAKVMVRDVPRRNLQSSRAVSSSAFNINERSFNINESSLNVAESSQNVHQDVRNEMFRKLQLIFENEKKTPWTNIVFLKEFKHFHPSKTIAFPYAS